MLEWAKHEFQLNKSDKNGVTLRDHLMQVKKATKRSPEGLENPTEFPSPLSYVWSSFVSLNNARGSGFSGPSPISYQEILAWKELTNVTITPREVDIIKRLDNEYLKSG